MPKITCGDISRMSLDDTRVYREWREVHDSLTEFSNKATKKVFKRLFSDYETAERLWSVFVCDLNRDIFDFLGYLTSIQKDELLVNCHTNKNYLYN